MDEQINQTKPNQTKPDYPGNVYFQCTFLLDLIWKQVIK